MLLVGLCFNHLILPKFDATIVKIYDMGTSTIYRPSVCHQTDDFHIHYNIVLTKMPIRDVSNEALLRTLSGKVGGQKAGQVVEALLEKRDLGFDLSIYGVDFIKTETVPDVQICHKGEEESPAVDWEAWLFTPPVIFPETLPANAKVARIRHN